MTIRYSSRASKELVLQHVLENIDYRKRCLYLQEIISISKTNEVLAKMLNSFFLNRMKKDHLTTFSAN